MQLSLKRIQEAATGLFYMSEGDYPFEVISFDISPVPLVNKLRERSGRGNDTKVQEVTLDVFFKNAVTLYPGAGPEQGRRVQQFITLKQVLNEELSDITVYLVGDVEIEAFIIGMLQNGTYAGLRTKVIRT